MKKLLIIITLFVSSFFFISLEDAKADVTITDEDIETYITEDFLASRDYLISNNNSYLVIYDAGAYKYFRSSSSKFTVSSSSLKITGVDWYKWTGTSFSSVISNYSYTYWLSSIKIIDSSFDIFPTSSFNVIYNDKIYPAGTDTKMVTIYDIYNEINSVPDEEVPEELESVTNFYTMLIEKINYLAEQIANNYILLSIIGIFIVTFIFLLIFRRFL